MALNKNWGKMIDKELEKKKELDDKVNHPAHYTQGKVECIDAIEAAVTGLVGMDAVCTSQIIKYCWRWKFKNGKEDLKKAAWYLARLTEEA